MVGLRRLGATCAECFHWVPSRRSRPGTTVTQVSQPDADECQGARINLTNLSTVLNNVEEEFHLTQRN